MKQTFYYKAFNQYSIIQNIQFKILTDFKINF